ncbi:MAG TPA: hypothetical protein VGI39_29000 [Polyangiaceae bacterium]|jgi:hypothetical protein
MRTTHFGLFQLSNRAAAAALAIGALSACSGADPSGAPPGVNEDPSARGAAALSAASPSGVRDLLPPGGVRQPRASAQVTATAPALDYPATLVGTVGNVTVYYDPSLGSPGYLIASELLNVSSHTFADMQSFFGVSGGATTVVIAPLSGSNNGLGGAYHYGCDFASGGTLYLDATFASTTTDPLNLELGLFVAELSEAFMGAQGAGWGCGYSNGEALSRYLAEYETPPHTLDAYATGPSWVSAGFPDWISSTEFTDRDSVSTGAGILYLYWMRSRGYTVTQITHAGGATLEANYQSLTGARTGYADLTAALRGRSVTSDNPFAAPVTSRTAWIWSEVGQADDNYTYNSTGAINTVTHVTTGQYSVTFGGSWAVGGNAQVVSYGYGSERCKIASWGSGSGPITANVLCHTFNGTPVDAPFVAIFQEQGASAAGAQSGAYLWSDGETTPPSTYQWSANGSLGTVQHRSTGVYDVTFPGIRDPHGSPEVTAYGWSNTYCKIGYWYTDGSNVIVRVGCFAPQGAAADSLFTINFSNGAMSFGDPGASFWANDTSSSSYTPSTYYQVNTTGGVDDAGHYSTGDYFADFPGLPPTGASPFGGSLRSTAFVTAYGSGAEYCKVGSWGGQGTGARVNVLCFAANGTLVNTNYVPAFMDNDFNFSN